MTKYSLQNLIFLLLLIGLPLLLLFAFNTYNQHKAPGYYGPITKDARGNKVFHEISNFQLSDQDGEPVDLNQVKGKVVVANFFFASCPSICPQMMSQLHRVEEYYKKEDGVHIISFTVDPKRDSSAALKKYGEKYEVDKRKWSLLTGDKKEIYKLARNSYMLIANEGDGGPGDFIHSEKLVLTDPQNHVRGYYNGTDSLEVDKMIKDIRYLLKEEN